LYFGNPIFAAELFACRIKSTDSVAARPVKETLAIGCKPIVSLAASLFPQGRAVRLIGFRFGRRFGVCLRAKGRPFDRLPAGMCPAVRLH
jgi:hypothetical protein